MVVQTLIPMIGPLDTSHTASNLQIEVSGDTATLHCYMMSQHPRAAGANTPCL